ncbi:MAG: type II secretion system F family protein [Acidimicrobiales bacterium]
MGLAVILLGALFGFGLVLLFVALRGTDAAALRPSKPAVAQGPALGDRFEMLSLRLALGAVAAVLIFLLTGWPVAALFCGVGAFMAPSFVGGKSGRERGVAKIEAIASWAEMLRDILASAGGLEQSIIASASIAPEPIRPQVLRMAARLERDRLSVALRDFADEMNDPMGDLVVAALVLAADKSPKRLGFLLGELAQSARAEANMRLKVDAGRARTRTSTRVVTATTLIFTLGIMLINRDYMDPYNSVAGQIVLLFVGGLFALSFVWMARASRFHPAERFLTTQGLEP